MSVNHARSVLLRSCVRRAACAVAAAAVAHAPATPASADILLTEVIPNVTTTATRGDVVELFNTGPGAVDLTGWVLTDMDEDPVAGVAQDASFAPAELGAAPLGAGEFAVIEFVDASGTAAWQATNYGIRIVAPLVAGSFLGSDRDELLLVDNANTAVDFVAWSDTGAAVAADSWEDLSAVTGSVFDYGLTPGTAAWAGIETITSDAEYYAGTVDFTAFATVSAWGGGAIRRRSTAGVFDAAAPDASAQWEAVARHQATPGNASDDVPATGGLRPIRITGDLADWLAQIRSTTFPDRRLAPLEDQMPADFVAADLARRSAWEGVLAPAMNAQWPEAFAAAAAIGYEVVEFLDSTTGETFHVVRERFVPGEVGFTGMGTFVFFDGAGVRANLVLQAPHPINDSNTLEEAALAAGQVRPRVLMIAGAHRNNHTAVTTCDGMQGNGDPYRISDVSHHPDNFFHTTHAWLHTNLPDMLAIQLHGFCCPGMAPHAGLADDCVLSNGVEIAPGPGDFTQIWRQRIEAQNFLADGADLTTAAVFGDDAAELGGTNNLQARISNGVVPGMECNTAAVAAGGRFVHMEQDPDVREQPQHILTALIEALDLFDGVSSSCAAVPEDGCRQAGAGKSSAALQDSADDTRDRFSWKWGKGDATDTADFSDPVGGSASYHVCVYDSSPAAQPLLDLSVDAGGACAGKACWKAASTRGYGYLDKAGSSHGVTRLKLKSGAAGKSRLQVKAAGSMLALAGLPLAMPVTVQLRIDDGLGAECWQTTYASTPTENTDAKFQARQ